MAQIYKKFGKEVAEKDIENIAYAAMMKKWTNKVYLLTSPMFKSLIKEAGIFAARDIGRVYTVTQGEQLFIKNYGFKFAKTISKTAVENVRSIVGNGLKEGLNKKEIADLLQSKFTDMSRYKSEMIARTETIRASNAGAKYQWKSAGIKGMKWRVLGGACEECQRKADMGVIGIDDNFGKTSYETIEHPPLHPRCRCALEPFEDFEE